MTSKTNKRLWIVIVLGILLASYPLYGKYIGDMIFGTEDGKLTVSGTIEKVGSDYVTIKGTTIHLKGDWKYNGTVYTSEELIKLLHPGETVKIEYIENPRWGGIAEKIIFSNGKIATREE